jgi:adenosine kinase
LSIIVTGSVAFDYIMSFPGYFKEHILPEKIEILSVSFLVDSMRRERGGCATNIAYSLGLLGERPRLMATVGQDFEEYRVWLEANCVDTSLTVEIPGEFTSSCFINTDLDNNQIVSFYNGAMSKASTLSFHDLDYRDIEVAIISPSDPAAMVKYARECQELSIPYIYDPSQQIIRLGGEELVAGIGGCKVLVVNDYEFEMTKNKTGLTDEEILELTETVVITRGEGGSTVTTRQGHLEIPPIIPQPLVEPTGVGDAYRAGLIKGIVHGYSWETTGRLGSLAATYTLESYGTQNHSYTLEEFVARYRENFGDAPELADLLAATYR